MDHAGPIGSAVLTFIGFKQTDKQTDRQAKYIYRVTGLPIKEETNDDLKLFKYDDSKVKLSFCQET